MISIVIPVYNAAEYLPNMLESIVGQSYSDIEIILVNDGSKDNSSNICHEYANRYGFIKVYDCQNRGASASRNFGAEKASGEFIWFMDSDDVLENDALLNAVEAQKLYDADVVVGGMNFCFTDENKVVKKSIQKDIVLNKREFMHEYKELFSANYISSLWNKLIRRSVIVKNNIKMNEALHMYEDYVFCMDTLLKCKTILCLSTIFYNYKLRNTKSLSHRYKDNAEYMFCILENKISQYREVIGKEDALANKSLSNLLIYLAYECVKNEARHKNPYIRVKNILGNESFHKAMLKYKAFGKKYRSIHIMMKNKMTLPILLYLKLSGKTK